MLCAFFNFAAAELELDQRIPAIRQVKYAVRFQIRTVVVIRNLAAEGRRVNLQVPDAETLKNETERFQILLQILRRKAHCGNRDGWVGKLTLFSGADRRCRANRWTPRFNVLNDKQLFQCVQIGIQGGHGHAVCVCGDIFQNIGFLRKC